MKIVRVETIPVSIPYKEAYVSSAGPYSGISNVFVRITTDEGIIGIGETSFSPEFGYGATQEGVVSIIDQELTPCLVGQDPFDIEKIFAEMDLRVGGNPYAKAGVDYALYDLMGKSLNVPVYKLLGGCYRKRFPLSVAVGISTPETSAARAREGVENGFKSVKILVGGDRDTDVKRVFAIREAIGDDVPIRIDPNAIYTATEAIEFARAVERARMSVYEQPVPATDLAGMARVRNILGIPLMADEAVTSPQDAINLVRYEAADVFNIKTQKVGGLNRAKRIAAIADAANLTCFASGRPSTSLGTAQALHFVASTRNISYHGEFHVGLLFLRDDVARTPLRIEDGTIAVPEGPGLGVEIDEAKLAKYRKRTN